MTKLLNLTISTLFVCVTVVTVRSWECQDRGYEIWTPFGGCYRETHTVTWESEQSRSVNSCEVGR